MKNNLKVTTVSLYLISRQALSLDLKNLSEKICQKHLNIVNKSTKASVFQSENSKRIEKISLEFLIYVKTNRSALKSFSRSAHNKMFAISKAPVSKIGQHLKNFAILYIGFFDCPPC